MNFFDVLIIGASASGLMCAIEAGKRGRKVMVLDHANKVAKKIRISGGGKCNFTNYDVSADNYLSSNPHFCKSALSRYHYYDFLALMGEYDIPWHEREHGQLFCDRSANDIVQMLLTECDKYSVSIQLESQVQNIEIVSQDEFEKTLLENSESRYLVKTSKGQYTTHSLVIATGGLSVTKMGASDFGLRLAKQFGINVISTRPGLVPLTYNAKDAKRLVTLSGTALSAEVSYGNHTFKENLLFTHKGISGPAVLQISSYWTGEDYITIKLMPEVDLFQWLLLQQQKQPKVLLKNVLSQQFTKRLVEVFCNKQMIDKPINQYNEQALTAVAKVFQHWKFWPQGTEGYRVAEVTVGGVDTHEISSKTMETQKVKGLYFIGEVLDVTGHLGGFNFQWAWASGYTAGQFV